MSESDQNLEGRREEKGEDAFTDPYVSDSSSDIYATPEVVETQPFAKEEAPVAVVDTHGLFSGNQAGGYGDPAPYGSQPAGYVGGQPYVSKGGYGAQTPYNGQIPYGNQSPYGGQSYGSQGGYNAQTAYNNQNTYANSAPYGNQAGGYGEQASYGAQPGGDSGQFYGGQDGYGGGQPYSGQSYGSGVPAPYGSQNAYGNQPPYGYGNPAPYANQAGGGYGGQPPFGGQPPYDNPYSPFARPQKKQHTGLIIGIVVVIIALFLIAVFALASRAVNMLSEKEKKDLRREVYDFSDDYDYDYEPDDDYGYDYDYDYDYGYGPDGYGYFDDDYGYGYPDAEYDSRYYTWQQDIKDGLSYEMDLEDYEYESDYENVWISATIPVISGDNVPNLDKLNEGIRKEVDVITELFETEYESRIKEDEDSYFGASLVGYVTYMDEDKLSIAYQEELFNDLGGSVYLASINIDMKSGVILDNEEMLTTDDAFSVEFRKRSDEQNGEIYYLYYLTDQQITEYFNSENIIVFYTPKGMEIGFNYEEGWVTVTYEDYENYLKVF